ncbi:MAG: pantetheine-phosphate adenylyltransferase [Bacteroidales bacterium]|nr:pantetheine-phosphate adenylyltransferase [Bacteroidales bacterium]
MKRAVFPGSFDPITIGHQSVIERALPLFDEIIIAIGINATKSSMFDMEARKEWIEKSFNNNPKIIVKSFDGLTVDFCKKEGARYILRGLRTAADFEFERGIGQVNKLMSKEIETIFMLTSTAHTPISSSIVRDVVKNNGDISKLVPDCIVEEIKAYF